MFRLERGQKSEKLKKLLDYRSGFIIHYSRLTIRLIKKMEYRQLGKSDLEISRIGFGCMSLGSNQQENETLIHYAIESGINFFDTADFYDKGENEISLGKTVKDIREKLILATKVGNQWRKDGSGWDWNPRKSYILAAAEESLKRLQTDYIDLYQLHGGTIGDDIDETIDAFETLKAQGKIRYYGISSIRPNVIREYIHRSGIVSVMMQYSLLDRRPEESCLELLKNNQIGVLTRGSLAKGLLVNKKPADYLGHSAVNVGKAADTISKISGSIRTNSQTAIQFVFQQPAITAAVVGIRTMSQLEEIVKVTDTHSLNKEEYSLLRESVVENFYDEHR